MALSSLPADCPSITVINFGLFTLPAAVAFGRLAWILSPSSYASNASSPSRRPSRSFSHRIQVCRPFAALGPFAAVRDSSTIEPKRYSTFCWQRASCRAALMCGHPLNAVDVDAAHLNTHAFRVSTFGSCIRIRSL